MLHVRICTSSGAVVAEGTCSDSGYFPAALAGIYNAGRDQEPARSLESLDATDVSADYPVGVRQAVFGYSGRGQGLPGRQLDDAVTVHVERV
jgi:hypothetical protein